MIKWLLITIVTSFTALGIYLYFYLGANQTVETRVEPYPALQLVYRSHVGPYHKIGELLIEIENAARKQGLACDKTFGRFLDDPNTTDEDRLRSEVGCVVNTEPSANELDSLTAKFMQIPSQKYVYGKFKGSPAIGPFVVYPKLKELANTSRLQLDSWAIEIYKVERDQGVTTEYLLPVASGQ